MLLLEVRVCSINFDEIIIINVLLMFHFKLVKPLSDVAKFKDLITQTGYPQNQNVIRMDNLPADSTEDIVRCLFPGKFIGPAIQMIDFTSHVSVF